MQYTTYEILYFFFVYAFLGWCAEVLVMAFRTGKFCNRGMLSLPLCLHYGFAMVLLTVAIPTLKGHYLVQAIGYLTVPMACMEATGQASVMVSGTNIWEAEKRSILDGTWKGRGLAVLVAVITWFGVALVHPFVFISSQLIPAKILKIVMLAILAVMMLDLTLSWVSARVGRESAFESAVFMDMEERKAGIGRRLIDRFWRRLKKAYPHLEPGEALNLEKAAEEQKLVFAQGLCLHKLVWVFLISSFLGDIIETIFVRLKAGVWMSRASVLYGPFSVVWGIGATLLTLMLYRLRDKEDRYIFIGGFFVGGIYEYMASLILEKLLGTRFWDYSNMPFNLNGRTNLLYCIFWGLLGVFWIKICYPVMSRWIEKMKPIAGVILTWVLVAAMCADLAISGLAILRYVERQNGVSANDSIDRFMDDSYPDSMIERTWPNLTIQSGSSSTNSLEKDIEKLTGETEAVDETSAAEDTTAAEATEGSGE